VDRADLGGQIGGHRGAIGLVFGEQIVAEGFTLCVEYAGPVFGGTILLEHAQHADEAANGPGGFAAGGAQSGIA